jgi:hypothetical protein
MKWRLATLLAFLMALVFVGTALADSPDAVIDAMFAKHSDFPCVQALNAGRAPQFDRREPVMDNFAAEKGLDANRVQCFWFTWLFDRDENALNPYLEAGSGVPKGHYFRRGITNYDRAALYWHDINEVVYELSGQPAYPNIDDANDRAASGWARYPVRRISE